MHLYINYLLVTFICEVTMNDFCLQSTAIQNMKWKAFDIRFRLTNKAEVLVMICEKINLMLLSEVMVDLMNEIIQRPLVISINDGGDNDIEKLFFHVNCFEKACYTRCENVKIKIL